MFIDTTTHDLYVANEYNYNVLVFHRGQTTPYNVYTDPTGQFPIDVTMAKDGTVIASNIEGRNLSGGSISTWIGGPNGGTFVGNFPMTHSRYGGFIAVRRNGRVYYDGHGTRYGSGTLWSLSCPAGKCGTQTQVPGVRFTFPGGLAFDASGDLLETDQDGKAETFELPNPTPVSFPLVGGPTGMAINELDHHWFVADSRNDNGAEYSYPSGKLIGTVPGNPNGIPQGIAVDP